MANIYSSICHHALKKMANKPVTNNPLIEAARNIGGLKTKNAVVRQALLEYIQKRQQLQIVGLFGSIDYDAGYDYKAQRMRDAMILKS